MGNHVVGITPVRFPVNFQINFAPYTWKNLFGERRGTTYMEEARRTMNGVPNWFLYFCQNRLGRDGATCSNIHQYVTFGPGENLIATNLLTKPIGK